MLEGEIQGWTDKGDDILVAAQGDYGEDDFSDGEEGDNESDSDSNDGEDLTRALGKGCPTDSELRRARRLLRDFEDDLTVDPKGKVSFRRALLVADLALRRESQS